MVDQHAAGLDQTAERVALWRALHAQVDAPGRHAETKPGAIVPWRDFVTSHLNIAS